MFFLARGHGYFDNKLFFVLFQVDDMIDDVKSFVDAAHILKDRGAYKIYALATHGILSADAPRLIDESPIDEVCIKNILIG